MSKLPYPPGTMWYRTTEYTPPRGAWLTRRDFPPILENRHYTGEEIHQSNILWTDIKLPTRVALTPAPPPPLPPPPPLLPLSERLRGVLKDGPSGGATAILNEAIKAMEAMEAMEEGSS